MKNVVIVFGILFLCSGVLAEITINDFNEIYNLGDRLYVDLSGLRGASTGNLDIDLKCGNASVNLVRIPARAFSTSEDQDYSIPYKVLDWEDLGILDLNNIVGTCQVVAKLGGDAVSSDVFEISDEVNVKASSDKAAYDPGQEVVINIEAVKENGVNLNGFFEVSNGSSFSGVVEDGSAVGSFVILETAEAGPYFLNIHVYDVGDGGVMNKGDGIATYYVNQVPTSLVLSLSDTEVVPGNNFTIGLEVFDQSGVEMGGNVFLKVVSPSGDKIERVVEAGDFVLMDMPSNSSVGTWTIVSTFDGLSVERNFEILPYQKVDFDFEESVLVVRNVGNVLYNKTINVNIGGEVKQLKLNIGVGEVRKFSLAAPVGSYEVVVDDGDSEFTRQVLLTGNAVSVSDFKDFGIFKNYSILWIFLIVVLGGIGGVLFMRYRKTRTIGEEGSILSKWIDKIRNRGEKSVTNGKNFRKKVGDRIPSRVRAQLDDSLNFTKKSPAVQGFDSQSCSADDNSMVDFTKKSAKSAESALVLKGEKQGSAVIAISVKNYDKGLSDVAKQGLLDIVDKFKGKGLIDCRNDYVFVVFSPLVTKTYKNESLAVRSAMKIFENLKAYNKKFKDKVDFGIGVHMGDMVASKQGDKLKYTGIGNTISFSKRMADVDSGKVIISEVVRKKMIRELKVSKGKDIGENLTYIVDEVIDRSGDAERLKQIMARSEHLGKK